MSKVISLQKPDSQHEYLLVYEINRGGFPIAKIYFIDHVNGTISRILGVSKKKLESQGIHYYYAGKQDLTDWIYQQGFKVIDIDNASEIIRFTQVTKPSDKLFHCSVCQKDVKGNDVNRHFYTHFSYGSDDDIAYYIPEVPN